VEEGGCPPKPLAKEDWSFGGLRRNASAAGSCRWGSTCNLCCEIQAAKRTEVGRELELEKEKGEHK